MEIASAISLRFLTAGGPYTCIPAMRGVGTSYGMSFVVICNGETLGSLSVCLSCLSVLSVCLSVSFRLAQLIVPALSLQPNLSVDRVHTKNLFKIHRLFTNICSMYMVLKSNTKVHNSSAHPVKGRNPYYSGWPMHSISQN